MTGTDTAVFAEPFDEALPGAAPGYRIVTATSRDLRAVVALLSDDPLGQTRESADLWPYRDAFAAITADPRHALLVVRGPDDSVAGTLQLTLIPGLSRGGATRLQIEAVRVGDGHRGAGVGQAMVTWAHEQGRARGATLAQLTSDRSRVDALRFYQGLGYVASHEGFKLDLSAPPEAAAE